MNLTGQTTRRRWGQHEDDGDAAQHEDDGDATQHEDDEDLRKTAAAHKGEHDRDDHQITAWPPDRLL